MTRSRDSKNDHEWEGTPATRCPKKTGNHIKDVCLHVSKKTYNTKSGETTTYSYWVLLLRKNKKTQPMYIGSCRKMDLQAAKEKARSIKAENQRTE
jgi:hypothetical protein